MWHEHVSREKEHEAFMRKQFEGHLQQYVRVVEQEKGHPLTTEEIEFILDHARKFLKGKLHREE